jgi:hypothetical protein
MLPRPGATVRPMNAPSRCSTRRTHSPAHPRRDNSNESQTTPLNGSTKLDPTSSRSEGRLTNYAETMGMTGDEKGRRRDAKGMSNTFVL